MKTTRSLHRRWMCCVLTVGSLSLIGVVVLGETAGGEEAKRDAKEAAKMVEAIANRNKPPEIVQRKRRVCPSELPLFPKGYDWKEEVRVRKALAKLGEDTSVEAWEALVQKANDQHYCVASYSGSSADVYIDSVGTICHMLAYGCLHRLRWHHLSHACLRPLVCCVLETLTFLAVSWPPILLGERLKGSNGLAQGKKGQVLLSATDRSM